MERDPLDTELFIDEVEKRRTIWDMKSQEYCNRSLRRNAWEEIVEIFCDPRDSEEKKKNLGVLLQKKWRSIRDNFTREMRERKKKPPGSAAAKKRPYIYFKRLRFLERPMPDKITKTNIENTPMQSYLDVELDCSDEEDVLKQPLNQPRKKTRTISAPDKEFLNILQKDITENDPDKLFCLYLHKELVKIPEDIRFQIKIEIMNVIQKAQRISYAQPAPSLSNTSSVVSPESALNCKKYSHRCHHCLDQ